MPDDDEKLQSYRYYTATRKDKFSDGKERRVIERILQGYFDAIRDKPVKEKGGGDGKK